MTTSEHARADGGIFVAAAMKEQERLDAMGSLRVSVHRRGATYEGVIRDGKTRVAWACGHFHRNRDQVTYWRSEGIREESAYSCARQMWTMVADVVRAVPGLRD